MLTLRHGEVNALLITPQLAIAEARFEPGMDNPIAASHQEVFCSAIDYCRHCRRTEDSKETRGHLAWS